jgi:ubiquitin-conjugating enzyme E2 S
VKLVLQNDYPSSPPRGYFLTKIFHPNVSNNGDICVNTLKRDWKPEVTLSHIFQVIRCLLIIPFPESSLNDEAGKLFMESFDEFAKRAKIMMKVHAIPVERGESSSCSAVVTTSKGSSSSNDTDASENDANLNNTPAATQCQTGVSTTVFNVVDANINSKATIDPTSDPVAAKAKKAVSSSNPAKDAKKKSLKRL